MNIETNLILATILLIATQQDWKYQRIPDTLTGPAILIGVLLNVMTALNTQSWQPVWLSALAFIVVLGFGAFLVRWNFWSAGDHKLLLACATFYGFNIYFLDFTIYTIIGVGLTLGLNYYVYRMREWVPLAHCFLLAWLIVFLEPIIKGLF